MSMEQLRIIALDYYENLPEKQKQLATDYFNQASKLGGQKGMTLREVSGFLQQRGLPNFGSDPDFFTSLDKNGNGILEFDEFIALYYICVNRRTSCCGKCGRFLMGDYFTCVQCFHDAADPYNLCHACYNSKKFEHHKDAIFLDNNTLLLKKRDFDKELRKPATAGDSAEEKPPTRKPPVSTPEASGVPKTNLPPKSGPTMPGRVPNQTKASDDFLKKYNAAMSTMPAATALASFSTNTAPQWYEHLANLNQNVDTSGAQESHISGDGATADTSVFDGTAPTVDTSAFDGTAPTVDTSAFDGDGIINTDSVSGFSDFLSNVFECSQM